MDIQFKDKAEEWPYDSIIIVGGDGSDAEVVASIAITEDEGWQTRVNVLSSAGSSCFQDLRYIEGIAYIGYGVYVFAVDTKSKRVVYYLLDGYFSHMYDVDEIESRDARCSVFVTSASEVYALSRTGDLLWKQSHLGIDGVVLFGANSDKIKGAGDWDPPGGWRNFALLSDSGAIE